MSLEQIQAFSEACEEIKFAGRIRKEIYGWVEQTLVGQQYHILGKEEKVLLRVYLEKRLRARIRRKAPESPIHAGCTLRRISTAEAFQRQKTSAARASIERRLAVLDPAAAST